MVPKVLYKYKALSNLTEMERLLDILETNKLYFPTYDELNDPLEGAGYNIELDGWAGMSIIRNADIELRPIESKKRKYRILSLAEDPASPQLWAHYTNNYQGVCLCFSTCGRFKTAQPVQYNKELKKREAYDDEALTQAVEENFFHKQYGWAYEKEWRIIERKKKTNSFFAFEEEDLIGIILGNNLSEEIQKIIIEKLRNKHIKMLKTRIGYSTYKINLLPWEYEIQYDGSKPCYIKNVTSYLNK